MYTWPSLGLASLSALQPPGNLFTTANIGQHLPRSTPQATLLLLNNVAAANQHRWQQTSTYTGGFSVHTVSVKGGEGSAGHLICEGAQAQRPDTINSLTASTCLAEAAKAGQNNPGLPES